jgi:peptidoglycan/xylan/chitin deacetylase (PgdA/CDA1 family)
MILVPGLIVSFAFVVCYLLDMMVPGVNIFSRVPHRLPKGRGVALTFDDGPAEPYTRQVLDILDRYGVKAAFFCIGENVDRWPELAREIVRRGHLAGSHSQSHPILPYLSKEKAGQEIRAGMESLERATGVRPSFFRFPKGYKSRRVLKLARSFGQRAVGFTFPIFDVENPPPERLIHNALSRVRDGDILLMHDGYRPSMPGSRDSLVAALPKILDGIRERGLEIVRLDDGLAD